MALNDADGIKRVAAWQRNLLIAGAAFSVLLIAMGGVLCVTQSIRNCPDWPGCFGTFIPPSQPGPILEYTHRALAALSGLLILAAAISGLVRSPRIPLVTIPPVVSVILLVEVSYFGAQVVLRGLAPGWAAVDVGSALLVVALMVVAAVVAASMRAHPGLAGKLSYRGVFSRLVLAATVVVYIILVSGILVAGKSSITACLGWPIYNLGLFQSDGHGAANSLRWILSFLGILLLIAVIVVAWQNRLEQPALFRHSAWLGVVALFEALVQALLLGFGHQVSLLVTYTVTAALFWALLAALMVRAGWQEANS